MPRQANAQKQITTFPTALTRLALSGQTDSLPFAHSTRDLSNIRFYEIFAVFKIAVVIQQIYFRYVQGQTTDERFATFNARVEFLARQAAALAALA